MEYAVYIAVPNGEDADLIARHLLEVAPATFDFSLRDKGDPSESTDVELCFRIRGVAHPEDALSQALELYTLGRRAAGLRPDSRPSASLSE
jgi:hypothetical protein